MPLQNQRAEFVPEVRGGAGLSVEGENVEAVVFAGVVPVLASGAEAGAEGFVEGLAGAGAGVAVDFIEVARDATDESGRSEERRVGKEC